MIEVAICDEEKKSREGIAHLVAKYGDSCKISLFSLGKKLIEENKKFDIILMDIKMQEDNGFEIAKRLRKTSDAIIIFITELKDYVFDAFDVDAFHYLLKPVDEEKFIQVFERALKERKKEKTDKKMEPLVIKVEASYRKIPLEDILYMESRGRKVLLHTKYEEIEFYGKIGDFEKALENTFFRCHRGYLVNLREISAYDNASITLTNQEVLIMARQKYPIFATKYQWYLKKFLK